MRPPIDNQDDRIRARYTRADHPLEPKTRQLLSNAINRLVFDEATRRLDEQYCKFSSQTVQIDKVCDDLSEIGAFDTAAEIHRIQQMKLTRREAVYMFEQIATALGAKWEADDGDFFDVTIGMARLQAILRGYVEVQIVEPAQDQQPCDVLIATMPGEEHIFAATLLELNMRLLGWNTTLFSAKTHTELSAKVTNNCYDVICLSWTTAALTDSLALLSKTIDALDINNRPVIIAGGASSEKRGKWLVRIGVDHICDTALSAVDVVRELLSANTNNDPKRHAAGAGNSVA